MMRPAFVKLSREDGIKMFPVSSKAFEPYFPLPIHVYICSANTYSNVKVLTASELLTATSQLTFVEHLLHTRHCVY